MSHTTQHAVRGAGGVTPVSSHRKEFVRWVQEAKREETCATSIAKTVDMVREGQTRN